MNYLEVIRVNKVRVINVVRVIRFGVGPVIELYKVRAVRGNFAAG